MFFQLSLRFLTLRVPNYFELLAITLENLAFKVNESHKYELSAFELNLKNVKTFVPQRVNGVENTIRNARKRAHRVAETSIQTEERRSKRNTVDGNRCLTESLIERENVGSVATLIYSLPLWKASVKGTKGKKYGRGK
ncbi:hypothetical protein AVEN_271921-1 [Araneus ventricosus]|uniref:Uncharacterized protein n=1 Tax=Araneus ventricosus TaxID=182803 RepID=A0A4Y2CB89_ARAVE|nr:hypothetical protein AVEN_271921-1 [Araneus ventricosus]